MARCEWTRWGRGSCEGYGLEIGTGPARFSASVVRNAYPADPAHEWRAGINGGEDKQFATREEAMAYIEWELSRVGEEFARDYAEFKVGRERNRWSRAVDAVHRAQFAKRVGGDGTHS